MHLFSLYVFAFYSGLALLFFIGHTVVEVIRERGYLRTVQSEMDEILVRRKVLVNAALLEVGAISLLTRNADSLRDAVRDVERDLSPTERLSQEQEISRAVAILTARAEAAGVMDDSRYIRFADRLTELQFQENVLATAREKYNRAAGRWNGLFSRFSTRIIAHAFAEQPAPFFEGS